MAMYNEDGHLLLYRPLDAPLPILLQTLMRLNGALQVATTRNGLCHWMGMAIAVHAAMDFMVLMSLVTIRMFFYSKNHFLTKN